MFKRILVPLDGSPLAESALAVAERVARASDGTLVLLRVVDMLAAYAISEYEYADEMVQTPIYAPEILDEEQVTAEKYLADIATSDTLAGSKVETKVLPGTAGSTILDTASNERIELIVMSSHGETGFMRWVLGSVAQHVTRHSPVPVFVLREGGAAPTDRERFSHALTAMVALDGSKLAEAALESAAYLAAALAAPERGTLLLSTVVKISTGKDKLEKEEHVLDGARRYLMGVEASLLDGEIAKLNLGIEWCIEPGKDVADALIQTAEHGKITESSHQIVGCDLIAMATHGRGGLQRWVMGSVTERVLGATKLPLLIIRPKNEQPHYG